MRFFLRHCFLNISIDIVIIGGKWVYSSKIAGERDSSKHDIYLKSHAGFLKLMIYILVIFYLFNVTVYQWYSSPFWSAFWLCQVSWETCHVFPWLYISLGHRHQGLRCMIASVWFPLWKLNTNHFTAGQRCPEGESPVEKVLCLNSYCLWPPSVFLVLNSSLRMTGLSLLWFSYRMPKTK